MLRLRPGHSSGTLYLNTPSCTDREVRKSRLLNLSVHLCKEEEDDKQLTNDPSYARFGVCDGPRRKLQNGHSWIFYRGDLVERPYTE